MRELGSLPEGSVGTQEGLKNPYPYYEALRCRPEPFRDAQGVVYLARAAEVERVLGYPQPPWEAQQMQGLRGPAEGFEDLAEVLSSAPNHARMRRVLSGAFKRRRVEVMAPSIAALAERLLAPHLGDEKPFDFMRTVASPLPVLTVCRLLGVPGSDHLAIRDWAMILMDRSELVPSQESMVRVSGAMLAFSRYLEDLVSVRRKRRESDLITALIDVTDEDGRLSDQEIVSLCLTLLVAGHETTTNAIGNGVLALLQHQSQAKRLSAQPSLVEAAADEVVRYDSPVQMTVRMLPEAFAGPAFTLDAGTVVFALIGSANRDPGYFTAPDALNIGCSRAQHFGFGAGIHYCLGARLARRTIQAALAATFGGARRVQLLGDTLEWRPNPALRGLMRLPVQAVS